METAHFAFRNRTLSLEGHEEAVRFAAAAFRELAAPAPAKVNQHAQVWLRDEGARVVFDGTEIGIECPEDDSEKSTSAFYATRDVFARFAASDPSVWAVYGAAVRCGAQALFICGPTTAGKSILATHLLARGAQFYGDEIVVIDRATGYTGGMRRGMMIRERGLAWLPSDAMRARCSASPDLIRTPTGCLWYAVEPDALAGRSTAAEPAPLGGVVILSGERVEVSALERVPPTVAALEVARYLYLPAGELSELGALSTLLARVPAYRLRLGPPRDAAAMVMGILPQ